MNGQKSFKFTKAHDSSEITAMSFDSTGRKLITGSRGTWLTHRIIINY
jgi:hypothetical protein